jgi:phosphoribosyl 1,2-cyclic phosphodiesterase
VQVRFWGTRGSIATPGESTVRYGGNTSCIEVRSAGGALVVIDCGTGARALGEALMASPQPPSRGHILISHTHWDHIQGLPFFKPLFVPGNEWHIYAPRGFEQSLQETLAGQMQYTYFPITMRDLGASIRYHEIVEGRFGIDDLHVHTHYLNHPALTLGYRIEADGVAVVYACDHEPHSRQLAVGEGDVTGQDRDHVEFLAGADLVIHDAQYTADEYDSRKGWGHSTAEYAVEMARLAGVRRLALTHHDPQRDDAAVDRIVSAIRARVEAAGSPMEVFAAAEGHVVTLQAMPGRPPELLSDDNEADAESAALAAHCVIIGVADPPALLIVDERLPDIDGPAIADAVRERGPAAARNLPIIVVTGSDARAAGDECAGDWLVKPFSVSYARTRIRAALLRTPCRWSKAPIPPDEERRLAALANLGLLDTPPEERFDRLTRLAAAIFDVPTALVSLVDRDRQWFKSALGSDVRESPRETSFCAHAVVSKTAMVVPDALADPRFAENPMVKGGPRVRFYAGQPLILPDGSCVGTVCVIDTRPRDLDQRSMGLLRDIGELVRRELLLTDAKT